MLLIKLVNNIFAFYYALIILRILMSWIPNINWYQQPTKAIREVTDLWLDIFRRLIPSAGGLDFSPIIAILVLQIIQRVVIGLLAAVLY